MDYTYESLRLQILLERDDLTKQEREDIQLQLDLLLDYMEERKS